MCCARSGYDPYTPQNVAVNVTDGIWTVEGPVVNYRFGPFVIPCPTRMTVLRAPEGGLFLLSPAKYNAELQSDLAKLGHITALIAPNSYHHLHVNEWTAAAPKATVYVAPGLCEKKLKLAQPVVELSSIAPPTWRGWLSAHMIDGGSWVEIVFFHESTKTLIFTDLIQNFELERVQSAAAKFLLRLGGLGKGPVISSELLMSAAWARRLNSVKSALGQLSDLPAARVLFAHGAQTGNDALTALREFNKPFHDR